MQNRCMLLNSKPGRYLVTRLARAYGFLDPVALLARLRGFAQQSEVGEPIELLRAGMLFHARGLVNTKAIQHNLDWVWPYWVERQFNPHDPSFIPRAFSFSHINLTHRNWTGVGLPDVPFFPIVDPRGLVTPLYDGWSLDLWVVPARGAPIAPSKLPEFHQELLRDGTLSVHSRYELPDVCVGSSVDLVLEGGEPHCRIVFDARVPADARLAVMLRPYNPEGVSFVERIASAPDGGGWIVNAHHQVRFSRPPQSRHFSTYADGDVAMHLTDQTATDGVRCAAGMATAAALFRGADFAAGSLEIRVPIHDELEPARRPRIARSASWDDALRPLARLKIGDARLQRLYDLALANTVLHCPEDPYPGPYTYKRFWFRDAVFILHALLAVGDVGRVRRALERFAPRQRRDGYFLSQEGEWDSNGEALWFYGRFVQLTGEPPPAAWLDAIALGARWISRKRLPRDTGRKEAGLLPAGFSAEHLGPNDFYYWDDFWAVAGLQSAGALLQEADPPLARACREEAAEFLATIERSFPEGPHRRFPGAIPASPHRRMDAGAIGSIVADYPLQLFRPGDERVLKTVDYLWNHSQFGGGFFQDMIHSGINVYLTLHLAQVRLRAGQPEQAWQLIENVARFASPTGQWPEAIHPRTGGGCMGDGQHIWAAAEWLLMIRNLFVREEADALVIGSGIDRRWLAAGPASFGPTLTPDGPVSVHAETRDGRVLLRVVGAWRGAAPALALRVPGCDPQHVPAGDARTEFLLPSRP
jgi:hypothetical protein